MWSDAGNYLRLDIGTGGGQEAFFGGCVRNSDLVCGRGRLPMHGQGDERVDQPAQLLTGDVHLRLERTGYIVRALCSRDGRAWSLVGKIEFPVPDSLQVGVYANGNIDRLVYPGAYPDGTGIRFGLFQMWGGRAGR
jgi:hypothetical protein